MKFLLLLLTGAGPKINEMTGHSYGTSEQSVGSAMMQNSISQCSQNSLIYSYTNKEQNRKRTEQISNTVGKNFRENLLEQNRSALEGIASGSKSIINVEIENNKLYDDLSLFENSEKSSFLMKSEMNPKREFSFRNKEKDADRNSSFEVKMERNMDVSNIKRPMNAFIMYSKDHRRRISA